MIFYKLVFLKLGLHVMECWNCTRQVCEHSESSHMGSSEQVMKMEVWWLCSDIVILLLLVKGPFKLCWAERDCDSQPESPLHMWAPFFPHKCCGQPVFSIPLQLHTEKPGGLKLLMFNDYFENVVKMSSIKLHVHTSKKQMLSIISVSYGPHHHQFHC